MAVVIDTECAPSSAPAQLMFDAVDELSAKCHTKKWTGSIKFCSLPVHQMMIVSPPDNACIAEINICDCLGLLKHSTVHPRLCLDLQKDNKSPLNLEIRLQIVIIGSNSRMPLRRLPTFLDCPSCPMAAEVTFVISDASFATVCTGQRCRQKRRCTSGR
jgi:hypothetical protein